MTRILDQKNPVKIKGWSDEFFLLPIRLVLFHFKLLVTSKNYIDGYKRCS
jgi:hypothetical protein